MLFKYQIIKHTETNSNRIFRYKSVLFKYINNKHKNFNKSKKNEKKIQRKEPTASVAGKFKCKIL